MTIGKGQQVNNEKFDEQHRFVKSHMNYIKQFPQLLGKLMANAPEGTDWASIFNAEQGINWGKVTNDELDVVASLLNGGNGNALGLEEFELKSGKKVKFATEYFTPEQLENDVVVSLELNGREQSLLTDNSTRDVAETLKKGQFYPCFACPSIEYEGKTDWLDGSRRRFVAIKDKITLKALVALEPISKEDAKYLANQIQTSHKSHNQREVGLRYANLLDQGLVKEQIINIESISAAHLNRCLRSAAIPEKLLWFIQDANKLSKEQWVSLANLHEKTLPKAKIEIEAFVQQVKEHTDYKGVVEDMQLDITKAQAKALKFITDFAESLCVKTSGKSSTDKPGPKKEKLAVSKDKKSFVQTSNNNEKFQLNFGRVTASVAKEMEEAALKVWNKHYGE